MQALPRLLLSKPMAAATKQHIQTILPWVVLFVLLAVSFWLRSQYLWIRSMTYDEGHWLMFAVLTNTGYAPYSETFVGIPPLALLVIQLGASLFDITLAVRYPMMLFSLVGIGSLFWLLQPWQSLTNLMAALLAAIFLSFDLVYFRESSTFMAEVPAVSMGLFSFALAWQYGINQKMAWLFLSGLAFGLSLALKIFMVFFPALMGLFLLAIIFKQGGLSLSTLWQALVAGVVWAVGVAVPWAIFLVFYDAQAMYKNIFLFRLAYRDVVLSQENVLPENMLGVARMLTNRLPLVIGAAAGLVAGWRTQKSGRWWLWAVWLVLAGVPLLWQAPLRIRYAVILLPPLAALSGIAVAALVHQLFRWTQAKRLGWVGGLLALAIPATIIAWAFIVPARDLARAPDPYTFPNLNFDVVDYVEQTTTPNDCIVTDDQRFAFAINRLVPADLSETAQGRLAAGWLTTDEIVAQIQQYDCPAVVYMVGYFDWFLPELRTKLRNLYYLEITYDEDFVVYTAKKQVNLQPAMPLEARFGDLFALQGVDLTPSPWQVGQNIKLATYWTALQHPGQAYKLLLQLRNSRDETVATFDFFPFAAPGQRYKLLSPQEHEYRVVPTINLELVSAQDIAVYPTKGLVPTNVWAVGDTLREITTLKLPVLTPGTYNLYLGMYDPDTLARLPVQQASQASDLLRLGQVEVVESK